MQAFEYLPTMANAIKNGWLIHAKCHQERMAKLWQLLMPPLLCFALARASRGAPGDAGEEGFER